MNLLWEPKKYRKLLEKKELTIEDLQQLQFYQLQVYSQLCYNSRNEFTSLVSKYLRGKMDPNAFRINFIDLCWDRVELAQFVELYPTKVMNLNIDFDPKNPFFDLKYKILNHSLTMRQEYDSEFLMSESEFQTLVARLYLDTLFSENV